MRYEIYLHKNKKNGKVYVGVTSKPFMKRWKDHVRKAKYNVKTGNAQYFQLAIVKHGVDAWEHELLEIIDGDVKEAEAAEAKWIAYYESNDRLLGYNSTPGGNISQGVLSQEVKDKISAKIKIVMADPERRKKQSEITKEWLEINGNQFKDKHHTDESKQKMSDASKKWHETNENPFKGKTHDEETRKIMSDAAKKRCEDPNWKAPSQINPPSKETKEKISKAKSGTHPGKFSKELISELCIELQSLDKVAEKLGCTKANICYLMKSYGIRDELNKVLRSNWVSSISKDDLIKIAKECKSQKDMADKLKCTTQALYYNFDKFSIREEIKQILKDNKGNKL